MLPLPPAPKDDDKPFDESLLDHAVRLWDAERENAQRLTGRQTLILTAIGALFGLGLFRIEWYRGPNDKPRIASPVAAIVIRGSLGASLVCFAVSFGGLFARYRFPKSTPSSSQRAKYRGSQALLRIFKNYYRPEQLSRRQNRPPFANVIRAAMAIVIRFERLSPRPSESLSQKTRASHKLCFDPDFFENPPKLPGLTKWIVFSLVYSAALELQRGNGRKQQNLDRFEMIFFVGLIFVIVAVLTFVLFSQ